MTSKELVQLKKDLLEKEINADKINKVRLKRGIYNGIGYICGIGIGVCIARVLMAYFYTGILNNILLK